MLRHIFHHRGAAEGCAHFCCTKIEDFGVSFGTFEVFSHINLHFHCGEMTAIIGPNGAGKSTLLRAILGEIPHTGHLRFVDADDRRMRPVIGCVPQYLRLDVSAPTTVQDLFMACLSSRPVWLFPARGLRTRIKENLARVRAEHLVERRLGALSGGELQRAAIARALSIEPQILLLDEPTTMLDVSIQAQIMELLMRLREERQLGMLLISHDRPLLRYFADEIYVLEAGKVR